MNKLINLIERSDDILILRHVNPDGDAFGSQWGLARFIIENYPNKNVYVTGKRPDSKTFFPENIEIDSDTLKDVTCIVLDSATLERIDGPYKEVGYLFNIDHHPSAAPYGDDYIVEPHRSSTCEMVASLLLPTGNVSKETASYLLGGILTDTNKFTTENTGPETLKIAASLMECGACISSISNHFFTRSYESLVRTGSLIQDIQYKDGLAWLIITKEKREALGISEIEAKNYNSVMANVEEFSIYIILVEKDSGGYSVSLRSRNATINNICELYGGGGHRVACGIRHVSEDQIESLKEDLIKAIKEEPIR